MSLSHYDAPTGMYVSAIPPGMVAFRRVVAQAFGYGRTEVVRDRSRCARQRSEHCECGACDFFTTVYDKGRKLFVWCVKNADALGIQSCIFWRRVVGFGNPNERAYTGASPHTDHVHIGLNRWARKNLTEAMVRAAISEGSEEDDMAQVPQAEWEQMKADMAAVKGAVLIGRSSTDPLYPTPIQLDDYVRTFRNDVFAELEKIKAKLGVE